MVQLLQKRLMYMKCNSNRLAAITMFPGEAFGRVKGYYIKVGTLHMADPKVVER